MDGLPIMIGTVAVVAIGRNEGERLKACLTSVGDVQTVVYVDSGSSDGSAEFASRHGALVVNLLAEGGFTAAKARNAGWRLLLERGHPPQYVQFLDGDCILDANWISAAKAKLDDCSEVAVVFGRRRERFPERSLYNRLCNDEWNVAIGQTLSCGGDALVRLSALEEVGGYNSCLIAGEEPDLCLRLRQQGWQVWRIDAEMTLHDAAITKFRQWWLRTRRAGHAFAEHVRRNGSTAIPEWRRQLISIMIWGLVWPAGLAVLLAAAAYASGVWLPGIALWVAALVSQWARISYRKFRANGDAVFACQYGFMMLLAKVAQLVGVLQFWIGVVRRQHGKIIEYKDI